MSEIPSHWHTGHDFVKTRHADTYPTIDSAKINMIGKYVLLTGASRGVGKEIAISYGRAGVSGIAIAARSADELDKTASAIVEAATENGKPTPNILKIVVDITDEKSVDNALALTKATFPKLDIVINNAGYLESPWLPIAKSNVDDWWKSFTVNIRGPYLIIRAFLQFLLESENGDKTIINITSKGAHVQLPGASAYLMAKFATFRIAEQLEAEYGEAGLLSYAIHPGNPITHMSERMPQELMYYQTDSVRLPADTIVWLTKEKRDWLNGRYVDCAWDMSELEAKKDEIVKGDKLKMKMVF